MPVAGVVVIVVVVAVAVGRYRQAQVEEWPNSSAFE
jgi:hypothetical protein